MSTLEEKQAYFKYPASGWSYKEPPSVPDEVIRMMEREGLDNDYRFIWLGVDVIRKFETDMNPVVRGDQRACRYQMRRIAFEENGSVLAPKLVQWLEPKKPFVHTRQLQAIFYLDDDGHRVNVTKPDFVPPGKLAQFEFEFHHFGALEWRIEERMGAGTRADLRSVFPTADNDVWYSIGTIRSKGGLYQEPSILHVQDLIKRRWENRNLSAKQIGEIAARESAQRDSDKAAEEFLTASKDREELEHGAADVIDTLIARAPRSVNIHSQANGG